MKQLIRMGLLVKYFSESRWQWVMSEAREVLESFLDAGVKLGLDRGEFIEGSIVFLSL